MKHLEYSVAGVLSAAGVYAFISTSSVYVTFVPLDKLSAGVTTVLLYIDIFLAFAVGLALWRWLGLGKQFSKAFIITLIAILIYQLVYMNLLL